GRSNLYRSDTVKGNTVPINIYARTRTYAGKVTAGETKSHLSACAQKEHNVNTVNSIHLIIIILLLT
ncbi:hypothetical protein AB9B79_26800, partial [Citrobacter freundii]|uniref:hypothetical protein n=1 Tax=Citrobacter freundii TaxID=546 RepID=UPI00350ED186